VLWDSVWDATKGFADWALAGPDENENVGGLRAKAAIETAVMLCLFTDKRESIPSIRFGISPTAIVRGYWGDGIDVRADLARGAARLASVVA
jgi:phage gp46-like protein